MLVQIGDCRVLPRRRVSLVPARLQQRRAEVLAGAPGVDSGRTDPLTVVEGPEFEGVDVDELLARLNEDEPGSLFVAVAHERTIGDREHPFLDHCRCNTVGPAPGLRGHAGRCRLQPAAGQSGSRGLHTRHGLDGVYRREQERAEEPRERTVEVDEIVEVREEPPWPGPLEAFRVDLLGLSCAGGTPCVRDARRCAYRAGASIQAAGALLLGVLGCVRPRRIPRRTA
ncbi:DUF6924 domain-containing protein [Rhodococcus ruber]|uniref:DUF6924 domain-containing protein n=1 Tax=Rhodococcus ruber TaxID=1830 RepID=UPI003CC55679